MSAATETLKFIEFEKGKQLPENHWPRVRELVEDGFAIPSLDYPKARYPVEWLKARADTLAVNDPELAELLRFIAADQSAFSAVNPKHRATINAKNIALLYLLTKRVVSRKKLKRYRWMIARLWGVADSTVKDAHVEHGKDIMGWLDDLIDYIQVRSDAGRTDIYLALAGDLCDRSAIMGRRNRK